ncbi:MAG: sensor histidine kinase [Pseudonocardiaceae bacterium]
MKIPGWIPRSVHIPPSVKWDALLLPTAFIFNCFLFSSWRELAHVAANPWLPLMWLYGLAGLLALVWRDRAPVAIFATQWVLTVAAWPFMIHYTPAVGIPVALYAVAVQRGRIISQLALLASFIPNGLAAAVAFKVHPTLAGAISSFIPNAIFLVLVTAAAWGAGRVTRASRRHVQQLEGERETTREAVASERRRIARELHDIVSHSVTVMVLQAAGAARVADTNFAQVTQSLAHIENTGKQAMAELRRLLGVLEAGAPAHHAAGIGELGPQPGLENLTLLLTSLRATGMPVTDHVEGIPRDLDPSVDLAAYRIVQEGLTNVLKHAGKDAKAQLRLIWEDENLLIQIDNDTNPAEARRGQALSVGRGLVGLNERAHAVGGRLDAGPHHKGGYRLTASLPLTDIAQRVLVDHHQ